MRFFLKKLVDSEDYVSEVSKILIAGLDEGDDLVGVLNILGQFVAYINHGPSPVGGAVIEPARTVDVTNAFGVLVRALWPKHAQQEANRTFKALARCYDSDLQYRRSEFYNHWRRVVARYLHFLVYDHTRALPQAMIDAIVVPEKDKSVRSNRNAHRRFSLALEQLSMEFNRVKHKPDSLSSLIGDKFYKIKRGGRSYFKVGGISGSEFSKGRKDICRFSQENSISLTLNALAKNQLEELQDIFSPSVSIEGLLVDGLGGGDPSEIDQPLEVKKVDLAYIHETSWMKVKIHKVLFDATFSGIWNLTEFKVRKNWVELHFFDFLGLASTACLTGDPRWQEHRQLLSNMVVQLRRSGRWILDNNEPQEGGGVDSYNFVHLVHELIEALRKSIPGARILFWFDPKKIKWADPRNGEKFRGMKSEIVLSYDDMRARMKGTSCQKRV